MPGQLPKWHSQALKAATEQLMQAYAQSKNIPAYGTLSREEKNWQKHYNRINASKNATLELYLPGMEEPIPVTSQEIYNIINNPHTARRVLRKAYGTGDISAHDIEAFQKYALEEYPGAQDYQQPPNENIRQQAQNIIQNRQANPEPHPNVQSVNPWNDNGNLELPEWFLKEARDNSNSSNPWVKRYQQNPNDELAWNTYKQKKSQPNVAREVEKLSKKSQPVEYIPQNLDKIRELEDEERNTQQQLSKVTGHIKEVENNFGSDVRENPLITRGGTFWKSIGTDHPLRKIPGYETDLQGKQSVGVIPALKKLDEQRTLLTQKQIKLKQDLEAENDKNNKNQQRLNKVQTAAENLARNKEAARFADPLENNYQPTEAENLKERSLLDTKARNEIARLEEKRQKYAPKMQPQNIKELKERGFFNNILSPPEEFKGMLLERAQEIGSKKEAELEGREWDNQISEEMKGFSQAHQAINRLTHYGDALKKQAKYKEKDPIVAQKIKNLAASLDPKAENQEIEGNIFDLIEKKVKLNQISSNAGLIEPLPHEFYQAAKMNEEAANRYHDEMNDHKNGNSAWMHDLQENYINPFKESREYDWEHNMKPIIEAKFILAGANNSGGKLRAMEKAREKFDRDTNLEANKMRFENSHRFQQEQRADKLANSSILHQNREATLGIAAAKQKQGQNERSTRHQQYEEERGGAKKDQLQFLQAVSGIPSAIDRPNFNQQFIPLAGSNNSVMQGAGSGLAAFGPAFASYNQNQAYINASNPPAPVVSDKKYAGGSVRARYAQGGSVDPVQQAMQRYNAMGKHVQPGPYDEMMANQAKHLMQLSQSQYSNPMLTHWTALGRAIASKGNIAENIANNMANAHTENTQNFHNVINSKQQAANIYAKINESRMNQHKVLSDFYQGEEQRNEAKRHHEQVLAQQAAHHRETMAAKDPGINPETGQPFTSKEEMAAYWKSKYKTPTERNILTKRKNLNAQKNIFHRGWESIVGEAPLDEEPKIVGESSPAQNNEAASLSDEELRRIAQG